MILESADQLKTLLTAPRVEILSLMASPSTCTKVADALGITPQKAHYHVKTLERAGLVVKREERRVNGIMEGIYQARSRTVSLSPRLAASLGGAVAGRISLARLLDVAEAITTDVQALSEVADEAPTMSIDATITLASGSDRARFMEEARLAIQSLAERYGAFEAAGTDMNRPEAPFRLVFACYRIPGTSARPDDRGEQEGTNEQ